MTNVTLTLPASTVIKTLKDQTISVDWSQVPANVLEQVCVVGAKTMLINTWNGGGKDTTEAERIAAVQKKIDAWYRGEINVTTRGDAIETLMREAYRNELERHFGPMTDSAFRKVQEDALTAAGVSHEKGKAIKVETFLKARATVIAARDDETRDADAIYTELDEKFTAAAEALQAEKAKALATIDTTGLDF